jgi:hypothetical protein
MQLQEARRADEALADPSTTSVATPSSTSPVPNAATRSAAGHGDGATAWLAPGATPVPTGTAEAAGSAGSPDAPLVILVARSFDAFATGPAVRVQLAQDGAGSAAPAPSVAAVTGAPAVEPGARWLVGGLKLLALVVGLGGAYLAGLFLLGAPLEAGPGQPPSAHGEPTR